MRHKRKLLFLGNLILCTFSIMLIYLVVLDFTGAIPSEYNIKVGDDYVIDARFPLSFTYDLEENSILEVNPVEELSKTYLGRNNGIQLKTLEKGSADLHYKVLGLIPYKTVKVNVVPRLEVYPGGQSIGVKLNTEGVLVVGVAEITDISGNRHSIAEKNGIRIGDSLIAINNTMVESSLHVAELVQESNGENLELVLKRNGREFTANVTPIQSGEDGSYKLGLWVRDKTAGVGTLTFYHKDSKKFGALGHGIADVDTGELMSIKDGEIMNSKVISIQPGKKGRPGEIRGIFNDVNSPIGRLEKNTVHGVYGEMIRDFPNNKFNVPMEIAYQHEIKEGPAYILTTLDDNQINKYDIEILRVINQSKADSKSMIIRITDPRLLEKTGGIVQGMSGSPIIQDERVVGAVTHVLVNDPTRGYGIFIEWMLQESGVFDN
ncbi:SpoIVB peptidase [Alkaliphilus transvaalensis]|uniref:SpoIVB peptidase n=1 Tax=Alkaliphilus transvaalensis TaxID=114628 RepID=UPI00047B264F|nr:SpoIVB peptidase [Alkaliphilus transvaalensis]